MSKKYKVSHDLAEKNFKAAYDIARQETYNPRSPWKNEIESIILGNHLTYRYILITGLMAKATNADINPLVLQAKSKLEGAYDARTLCHKVLVPLERDLLNRCLGGSNEPFLNKPARFTEISLENAVRKGQDRKKLESLYGILSGIQNSDEASQALEDAIYFALLRAKNLSTILTDSTDTDSVRINLFYFFDYFLRQSVEGQTSVLLLGTSLGIYYSELNQSFQVIVHPVNQSGASSREVADIDVILNKKNILAVEVKDKDFRIQDVDHALHKAKKAGVRKLIFALGPRGAVQGATEEEILKMASDQGMDLIFVKVIDMAKQLLFLVTNIKSENFFSTLLDYAITARTKDEVLELIRNYSNPVFSKE